MNNARGYNENSYVFEGIIEAEDQTEVFTALCETVGAQSGDIHLTYLSPLDAEEV